MGNTSYNTLSRSVRYSATIDTLDFSPDDSSTYARAFVQNSKRQAHEKMLLTNKNVRECRKSQNHPNAFPIILGLDVTGSMGKVPAMFLKDGLPTLFTEFMKNNVEDAAVCLLGIGDHIYDSYPFQAAEFESGDEELDFWLQHLYLEGGGGGNGCESYQTAWIFAENNIQIDAERGYIFTIGDEFVEDFDPDQQDRININPKRPKDLFGLDIEVSPNKLILNRLREKWNIYHFNVLDTYSGNHVSKHSNSWKELLGENFINIQASEIPSRIATIIASNNKNIQVKPSSVQTESEFIM